jgi:predicted DsbA family dithiol-disulfide isomerase/tRNA-binding EMAP/Myf-like protein
MKRVDVIISSRKLRHLVPGLPSDADAAVAYLRDRGVEIHETRPLAESLRDIVVGRVESVEPHPNADRLRICRVDAGGDGPLQIVTGASNVHVGGFYPVIRSGTTLPGGTKIRKGKLRGEVSEGMLGSAAELELGGESEGLLELEGDLVPGTSLPLVVEAEGEMMTLPAVEDEAALLAALASRVRASETIEIDLFADVSCPWCFIAEQRLSRALEVLGDAEVVWRWRPYQLQPGLPERGVPWSEFVAEKFGADAASALEHVREVGAGDGLDLRFDRITRAPRTLAAHRLILLAQEQGRGRAAAHAVFTEYFSRGADITVEETLVRIATRIGLEPEEARDFLRGQRGEDTVAESQDVARRLGISGVPFYIFNGRVAISGAQDVETFVRAIRMSFEKDG